MSRNLPDDWHLHFRRCVYCRGRYHASEGGCPCLDLTDDEREAWMAERDAADEARAAAEEDRWETARDERRMGE